MIRGALDPSVFPLDDVTVPVAGKRTAYRVLSSALRRAIKDLVSLPDSDLDPSVAEQYGEFRALLSRLMKREAGGLATLVRRANIGTFVRCLRNVADTRIDREAVMTSLLATAYAELAVMGLLEEEVRVAPPPRRVVCLGRRGVLDVPADASALVFSSGTFVERASGREPLPYAEGDAEGAFLSPIRGGILLARVDDNPLSDFEAHPDKDGNQIELGGRPAGEWIDSIGGALDLIERFLPELRAEIDLVVQQVVPVGFDDHAHLSASFQEAVGTIYCSLHPNPMTMAEAVIHEFSHNKLHALLELDPLIYNAFSPLYASPVRPDPRPLHGILLAVHAFQPVARLYERMVEGRHPWSERPHFVARWRDIIDGNHAGANVLLDNARPTPAGSRVLAEIRAWDGHFADVRAQLADT